MAWLAEIRPGGEPTVADAEAAFETLTAAGYSPEIAYLECVHQLKYLADLLHERQMPRMEVPHGGNKTNPESRAARGTLDDVVD